jgi:Protein of unknown function (DUF4446)
MISIVAVTGFGLRGYRALVMLAVLAFAGMAFGVLGLAIAVLALVRLNRAMYGQPGLVANDPEVELAKLRTEVDSLLVGLSESLRHIAVVRYDAPDGVSAGESWSLALLDDAGDGVVLSSLSGRGDPATYATNIRGGESDRPLTHEERQAVDYALGVAHER